MTMMLHSILLALPAVQAAAPAAPPPLSAWPTLAPLPWRAPPVLAPDMRGFVAAEVKAGRCATPQGGVLALDLAVRVDEPGTIRKVVPQAIGCPAVEQYIAGLVTGFARNNLRTPSPGWYRVAVTFTLA